MYTHWASMNCPPEAMHMLIVSGNLILSAAGGTQFSQPLCQTMEINNTLTTVFEGVRLRTRPSSDFTCALCLIPNQSTIFTHYGSSVCPSGWNLAYSGLMVVPTGANATTPICATSSSNLSRLSVSFLTDDERNDLACSVCSM